MEFIYKIEYLFLYFKLQSSSKYSPLDEIHLLRHIFHCSKQILNSSILMPFSASDVFCFTASTSAKRFSLRTSSSRETKIKSCLRPDW